MQSARAGAGLLRRVQSLAALLGILILAIVISPIASDGSRIFLQAGNLTDILRQVWVQQYAGPEEPVRWRASGDVPPAESLIHSPYDVEARYSIKRGMPWLGYKVHLTETCDEETPHLITQVETTAATVHVV